MDTFKFQVGTGDRLAFEIETPETGKPRFNPRMSVFDSDGREFLTNVYKKISRNGQFYLKTVEPKTLYTLKAILMLLAKATLALPHGDGARLNPDSRRSTIVNSERSTD